MQPEQRILIALYHACRLEILEAGRVIDNANTWIDTHRTRGFSVAAMPEADKPVLWYAGGWDAEQNAYIYQSNTMLYR